MNELTIFENPEFGRIRAVNKDGEPWLVAKDVCEALGYKNSKDAIATHVDSDDKTIFQRSDFATLENHIPKSALPLEFVPADIPNRGLSFINESGMYSLVFSSKLPKAKEFKHWVTSEVLPSIRKTGGYIAGQENLSDAELMAKALLVAQRTIDERNKQIEVMKPKALFVDAVSASETSILIGDLAKLLKQNGVDIGQNRLFRWLRDEKYLIKSGESRNMPTQRAMDLGLFEIKETPRTLPSGAIHVDRTPKVTGKGQTYFVNKFLKEN